MLASARVASSGGSPSHTRSASRVVGTARPTSSSRIASRQRSWRRGNVSTRPSLLCTSTGPSTTNRMSDHFTGGAGGDNQASDRRPDVLIERRLKVGRHTVIRGPPPQYHDVRKEGAPH